MCVVIRSLDQPSHIDSLVRLLGISSRLNRHVTFCILLIPLLPQRMQKIEQEKGKEEAADYRNRPANRRRPPILGNNKVVLVPVKLGPFKVQVPAKSRSADAILEDTAKLL